MLMPEIDDTPLGHDHDELTPAEQRLVDSVDGGDVTITTVTVPGPSAATMLTMADVLEHARLPEDYARIVLRPDIEAAYHLTLEQLGELIDAEGRLLPRDDDGEDQALADTDTRAEQARALNAQAIAQKREMAASVRYVLFRGMSSEDLIAFRKTHLPKSDKPNPDQLRAFNDRLIVATAANPTFTLDELKTLRGKLGKQSIDHLVQTANKVATMGGVDLPK